MKTALIVLALLIIAIGAFFYVFKADLTKENITQKVVEKIKPLERYTIENLSKAKVEPSAFTIGQQLKDEDKFTSYVFFFNVEGKKVSGLLNVPKESTTSAAIVMFRGYVDKEIYQTGIGTQRAGEVFAQNGYVTLAPDFLGYGESDNPSESSIEERFQTYTTAITLLSSIPNLNRALLANNLSTIDPTKVGIWGHSNGGQISLTTLEITGKNYPTVLWAPVSKPFPFSVLYYTDEFDDKGKALRKVIATFEQDYDIDLYSPTNYLDRIQAPIQLHQGSVDDAVPQKWSDLLTKELKEKDKEVEYFVYPGADHNLQGGWNTAVERSINFYNTHLR